MSQPKRADEIKDPNYDQNPGLRTRTDAEDLKATNRDLRNGTRDRDTIPSAADAGAQAAVANGKNRHKPGDQSLP